MLEMAAIFSSLQVISCKVKNDSYFLILSLPVHNSELEMVSGGYYVRIRDGVRWILCKD
jgi:hypothetical protein